VVEASSPRDAKAARAGRAVQTITVDHDKQLDWRTVESDDYRAYIANLRAIGCPEETVRDIIIADINKLYASKIAALYPSPKDFKYWRVEDRTARAEERDRDKKRRELGEEKRELIKTLLGIDYDAELARNSGRPTDDDWRYGFLSPEMQEQAKALHDKYRELERAAFSDGGMTPENRAKFMAVRAERDAEMAKLMGPEQFEEYQLRNSSTARNMRENLTAFQPTEDEFRQIFDLKKAFDDQFAVNRDGSDEAVRDDRKAAQQQLDDQLLAKLGPERFQEYKLSQEPNYREAADFAQRYNLPAKAAETIYQVQAAAQQEQNRVRNDPTLSATDREVILKQLAIDTQGALQPVLGDNWANYQSRNNWIAGLSQTENNSRRNRGNYGGGGGRDNRRGR